MRRVTSGETGAVDLGAVEGSAVSPAMQPITPERAAELSAMHYETAEPALPSVPTQKPQETGDGRIEVSDQPLCCPNCGFNLTVTIKMTGTVTGDGGE